MAKDSFESALDGFRAWASAPGRSLAGDAGADARELELLFGYMPDYLGISGPGELRRGHIQEILLDVYPRKVVVNNREDVTETIAAVRDLLGFLEDTQALAAPEVSQLRRELDEVEPEFANAVMDPTNWGPARAIMTSMLDDGVDLDDEIAVQGWIDQYNAGLAYGDDIDFTGPDEEPSLKELFGLPDELPPMRLPEDAELAEAARRAPMMTRLAVLADWTGEDGRVVDEDEELYDEDIEEGAAAVGVSTADFRYLWEIAYAADWIDLEEDEDEDGDEDLRIFPASTADDWAGTDDPEATLMCWDATLECVLSETLLLPDEDVAEPEINFEGHGMVLIIFLFLLRKGDLTRADASEILQEGILGGEPDPDTNRAYQEWSAAHGDPAEILLERLAELGAVSIGDGPDGVVEMTPLGTWALRRQIMANDVEIPLLPPPAEMSAVDLLSAAGGMEEDEFDAETDAWLASRDPLGAARELLSLASVGEPADRVLATGIATRVGPAAEPAWQDVMTVPELTPYAKVALTALAGGVPGETQLPGLELSPEDMAWMTTDVLAILVADSGTDDEEDEPGEDYSEELAEQLASTIPPGQEPMVFDLIARGTHPEAVEVLTMIGQYHPDKHVAKEARKCAYKAATRRANNG
jgi:hypothetical protein